jgi:hypothetical protein
MKTQLKKLVKSSKKLTLVEAGVLFVSLATATYLVCKALDKK